MRARAHRSIAFLAARSYLGVAMQFASTAILSRVLTPAEIGVFAVAAVFRALASMFRDFGVGEYLIQARELTPARIRAAFTLNLIVSWFAGLVIYAAAAPLSRFYGSAEIAGLLHVQACNFILIPFGAIGFACFRREMNFRPMFIASAASDAVGLVVAVVLALRGQGAMSLAWSSLAGVATSVAVSLAMRPRGFPRWPALQGLGEVVRIGGWAGSANLLAQLGRGAPEMILGRMLGLTSVAMFSRGYGLTQMFNQLVARVVTPICLPYFARAVRESGDFRHAYGRNMAFFIGIGWPLLGFLGLEARPLIRLVYGDQWAASVPLAALLCGVGAIDLIHMVAKDALVAHGAVREATRLQLCLQTTQILGLAGGATQGLEGACWGLLAASLLGVAWAQWHLQAVTRWTLAEGWEQVRCNLLPTCAALAPVALLRLIRPQQADTLAGAALGALAGAAAWALAVRLASHPLWQIWVGAPWRRAPGSATGTTE
ncbi:MAG: lipopolysaccharide biosynthesis protein [Burkholderiales bacterium]|nr:lipopolysaccharide biosynthesis protein [Burkholderiales bacterium]MDE1926426.1 lipopolysaccharide biosynthesis protein [Burkholderiales bacterium]MDE2505194.1 lipopolysaccharide biosynthesis protein [Burkholderiales bacterium]